ncbi:MAG: hypothetical protein EBS11_09490 [Janthinobacterium sp.]|nr:hypothetical protein [Janthinobacterium sp.]
MDKSVRSILDFSTRLLTKLEPTLFCFRMGTAARLTSAPGYQLQRKVTLLSTCSTNVLKKFGKRISFYLRLTAENILQLP